MSDSPRSMRRRMRLRLLLAGAVLPLALWAGAAGVLRGRVVAERPPARHPAQDQGHAGQDRPAQGHRAPADDADQRLLAAHRAPAGRASAPCRASRPTRRPTSTPSATSCSSIQRDLRAERRRLVRLRARLAQARTALAQRLVELYQADKPDIVTVIMSSKGFAELLERGEFMQRVSEQDQHIIKIVRSAKADATATAKRLDMLETPPAEAHRDRPAAPRRDRPRQAGPHRHEGRARRHARRQGARAGRPCAPSASSSRATSPG